MATNTPLTVTAKYYLDEIAYIIFYSSLDIRPVQIKKVHLATDGTLKYYAIIKDDIKERALENLKESDLYTFDEARTVLISFLNAKILEINAMVQPV